MTRSTSARICLTPRLSGVGGMVSFQAKLAAGLAERGVEVTYSLSDPNYDAVLVIGGTRQLAGLWRAKRRGVRLVQRLDGMNWIHRVQRTGPRHWLRAEYGNRLLAIIRDKLADGIVYQSEFSREWWEGVHGRTRIPHSTIYNGVDLEIFKPGDSDVPPLGQVRLLLVEGSLMGGYELGLSNAIDLAVGIAESRMISHRQEPRVELMVVGRIAEDQKAIWEQRLVERDLKKQVFITWAGVIPHEHIPQVDRSAVLLYSADLNPACPNSVIEALACGTPVIAFDTGALPELVTREAGRVVPYGGDPWKLEPPDIPALVSGAVEVLEDECRFREGARARAEAVFGLDRMVDRYFGVLLGNREPELEGKSRGDR